MLTIRLHGVKWIKGRILKNNPARVAFSHINHVESVATYSAAQTSHSVESQVVGNSSHIRTLQLHLNQTAHLLKVFENRVSHQSTDAIELCLTLMKPQA